MSTVSSHGLMSTSGVPSRQSIASIPTTPAASSSSVMITDDSAIGFGRFGERSAKVPRGASTMPMPSVGVSVGSTALWTYVPARRAFSFEALSGNVERFEVRCERNRLEGPVETGRTWSLPDGASDCRVFVFGEQGASFEFVEHTETESSDVAARTAVARSDVLD